MIPTTITDRLQQFMDGRFRFDPEPHTYWLGPRQLTPFSTWIKDYVEPFDEPRQAEAYGRKRGLSTPDVLALWAHNRWVGTMTHMAIERFYQALPPIPEGSEQDHPEVAQRFTKFLNMYYARLAGLAPVALELQAWHEGLGICGTLDFPAYHPATGSIYIIDWKTNGTFSTNENCYPKYMRGPFADVLDNKLNQYSMQVSFYRLILEAACIPTAGGALVHLPPGDAPAHLYQALDFRARIKALLTP